MTNSWKFFDDNLRILGPSPAVADPVAYNLYSGLSNIGRQLSQVESQLAELQNSVRKIGLNIGT